MMDVKKCERCNKEDRGFDFTDAVQVRGVWVCDSCVKLCIEEWIDSTQ